MFLSETPHIKLRKANGLINIDYTACDIIGLQDGSSTAAARSYNTIIGVYARGPDGKKIYLQNGYSYSTTTATKHHPRAAALASHNGYKIIPDIKPEPLHKLAYNYSNRPDLQEILKEVKARDEILKELQDARTKNRPVFFKNKNLYKYVETRRPPESVTYKNGNRETVHHYKTSFNYLIDIYYHVRRHDYRQTRAAFYGPKGHKPAATYYTNKYKVVINS